jgi:hypothetical protein
VNVVAASAIAIVVLVCNAGILFEQRNKSMLLLSTTHHVAEIRSQTRSQSIF